MERTAWLDGLRGLASIGVVICHAINFEPAKLRGILYRSYWNDPPEENRHPANSTHKPPFQRGFDGFSIFRHFRVRHFASSSKISWWQCHRRSIFSSSIINSYSPTFSNLPTIHTRLHYHAIDLFLGTIPIRTYSIQWLLRRAEAIFIPIVTYQVRYLVHNPLSGY